jgi:hypothetical protein
LVEKYSQHLIQQCPKDVQERICSNSDEV